MYHGPVEKGRIIYKARISNQAGKLDFTYYNAVYTMRNLLAKVKDKKSMKRVEKFLRGDVCPDCGGARLPETTRTSRIPGISLDEACRVVLTKVVEWVKSLPSHMPEKICPMAESVYDSFTGVARWPMDLGLGYLALNRATSTLSTGERQGVQLARAMRNQTTGASYVLDESFIGLHSSNIVGPNGVMHDLIADGNSVLLVDHDI